MDINCKSCRNKPTCRLSFGDLDVCDYYHPLLKSRPTHDEYYLEIARAVSKRSTCLRRQYGAVIVNNDEIIATGYNGAPRGEMNCCDIGSCNRIGHAHNDGDYSSCRSVHAEMNAIISASRRDMIGAILYIAGYENGVPIDDAVPCPICQRLIINAGIKRVVTK